MLFNKRTVYLGYSKHTFDKIRNVFDQKGIYYDYKIDNASFETAGKGAIAPKDQQKTENPEFDRRYELLVKTEEIEKANYCIHIALNEK